MPSVSALVQAISLDVTTELVAIGMQTPAWTSAPNQGLVISAATATTPIVVTIPNAPQLQKAIHVVIAGCIGMTEANGTWILTPTAPGATTFTITTYFSAHQGQYVNAIQNSVGVNPYMGGGQATTALTDGRIVLGSQHISENSSPPRIIFTPKTSVFGGPDTNDRSQGGGRFANPPGRGQTPEQLLEQQARMVAGEEVQFEVTCWAADPSNDPDLNFDALQVLYQQLIRSMFYLDEGNYKLGAGQHVDETKLDVLGRKIKLPLKISTPVLDYILGTQTLTSIQGTVGIQIPNQSTQETGWTGSIT